MLIDANLFVLSDCAKVRAGYPFRGGIDEVVVGDVGVVQMKDIEPGGDIKWASVIRTELEGRRPQQWIEPGDVLFVSRGPRFYAACVSQAPLPAVCSPHLHQLRIRAGTALLPEFLAWQLNQTPLQRQIRAAAEGSNQLSIRLSVLASLTISVPSLESQCRIVNFARVAREERALLQALIANREKQFDAIARSLAEAPAADHPKIESP